MKNRYKGKTVLQSLSLSHSAATCVAVWLSNLFFAHNKPLWKVILISEILFAEIDSTQHFHRLTALVGPNVQLLSQLRNHQERSPALTLLRLQDISKDVVTDVQDVLSFCSQQITNYVWWTWGGKTHSIRQFRRQLLNINKKNGINIFTHHQNILCHAARDLYMSLSSVSRWSTKQKYGSINKPFFLKATLTSLLELTVSTCLKTVPSPKNNGFLASTRIRSK